MSTAAAIHAGTSAARRCRGCSTRSSSSRRKHGATACVRRWKRRGEQRTKRVGRTTFESALPPECPFVGVGGQDRRANRTARVLPPLRLGAWARLKGWLMSNQSQGPTRQTVATTTASIPGEHRARCGRVLRRAAGGEGFASGPAPRQRHDEARGHLGGAGGHEERARGDEGPASARDHAARGARPARDGRIAPEAGRRQVGPAGLHDFSLH